MLGGKGYQFQSLALRIRVQLSLTHSSGAILTLWQYSLLLSKSYDDSLKKGEERHGKGDLP